MVRSIWSAKVEVLSEIVIMMQGDALVDVGLLNLYATEEQVHSVTPIRSIIASTRPTFVRNRLALLNENNNREKVA